MDSIPLLMQREKWRISRKRRKIFGKNHFQSWYCSAWKNTHIDDTESVNHLLTDTFYDFMYEERTSKRGIILKAAVLKVIGISFFFINVHLQHIMEAGHLDKVPPERLSC